MRRNVFSRAIIGHHLQKAYERVCREGIRIEQEQIALEDVKSEILRESD